jgi:hypothetical protein
VIISQTGERDWQVAVHAPINWLAQYGVILTPSESVGSIRRAGVHEARSPRQTGRHGRARRLRGHRAHDLRQANGDHPPSPRAVRRSVTTVISRTTIRSMAAKQAEAQPPADWRERTRASDVDRFRRVLLSPPNARVRLSWLVFSVSDSPRGQAPGRPASR